MIIGLIVILTIILFGIILAISYKNKFVVLDNRVKNAWSQIDVQLENRFSLIPNFVATVKGYAEYEKETLEGIIKARTSFQTARTPAEKMQANTNLNGFLGRLFAVSESYPDLKANRSFENLQAQLVELENKIRFARQFYNDTVTEYNQNVQMFPGSIFAGMFNYHLAELFKADEISRKTPEVKF